MDSSINIKIAEVFQPNPPNALPRFESLTLSHNNMIALKPVLLAWLEEAEAARRDPEGANGLLPSGEKKRD